MALEQTTPAAYDMDIKKNIRLRWLQGGTYPSSQPTIQPTSFPSSSSSPSKKPTGIPSNQFITGNYIEYVYSDSSCQNSMVYVSIQQLNTCYFQNSFLYGGLPVYMKSGIIKGYHNTTEVDYFFADSSCTSIIRNLTLTHPTTFTSCGPLHSMSNPNAIIPGYYVVGSVVPGTTTPSLPSSISGLSITDYSSNSCTGSSVESYFFSANVCIFNKYVASCTGNNNGPIITSYDSSVGNCKGKLLGTYQLNQACGVGVIGSASYEITSGCVTGLLSSLMLIELFIGLVLMVFICGCGGCACLRMMLAWRRNAELVVVDGGESYDRYIAYHQRLQNLPYPHMSVQFAVPTEARLSNQVPGNGQNCVDDLDLSPIAYATTMHHPTPDCTDTQIPSADPPAVATATPIDQRQLPIVAAQSASHRNIPVAQAHRAQSVILPVEMFHY